MLYSKVDKILGTSVHDSTIRSTPNVGGSSSTEDKPPVLPMPATMSPIGKSTFYRSTSSLSLRSSEYDKKSPDIHKQDQQRDHPNINQARRNALDPTNVPSYSQRAVHHDVRSLYEAPSHDLPFRRSPMNREYPPSSTANRQSNVQGWQNEVSQAQRATRSTVNLRKGEPVYDTYAMQRTSSNTGIRPTEKPQEQMPEGHFIDPFYASKRPQTSGFESGSRKRCESVGQAQSPLSVGNLARADEESRARPLKPLRPLRTNEISNFNPRGNIDRPRTPNDAILTSKWSSASTDTNTYHTSALTAGLGSPISISSCVTSTPPSSATQSAFRGSAEFGKVISPKSNTKTSPSVYSTQSFKSAQNDAFDDKSRRTNHADVKMFPLVRREALRNCLMDENVTKIEAAVRKGLMRKKDINERIVVLTTNARQIQGQLSAKLASLTGAQSIGQAKFSFNDLNGQEPFVILHCFKSDTGLAKEEERLTLSSHSFVAVAESSSSFHIDREVWALKIAGHVTSNNPPKTRAAEQQQSQWTLQFDTKHRMLKWQVILRALIAGLNEADQVFRIGPPLHQIKHIQSVNSISSASTLASSGGYQSVMSHHERSESYEEMYGSANSPRSSPRSPYHINKDEDLSRFVTSISSLSVNSDRTSTFVANQATQYDPAQMVAEKDPSFRQDRQTFNSPSSPPLKQSAELSKDQKRPSVQSRDFAVEEKVKADIMPESKVGVEQEETLGLADSPAPLAQSRKRSASVPQFAQHSHINSEINAPPHPEPVQTAMVDSAAASKSRKSLRPQQLPPPAAPLPVVPPRPTSALPALPPTSPTRSSESHQTKEEKKEEKVEDAAAASIRRMRTEIALAMACAAAPRSMSMTSSFTEFSEDIAEASKRHSAASNVKDGNESYKELENEEETVDNRSDLKVNPVGQKNGTDEVDAIYAMIDLSYNIYGLSSASNNPNVFIPNAESMNASDQTDGSKSVYFDEFASDPFQQMGTIKFDSASLQKARADLRNRPASASTDHVHPGNFKLEKRQSSLKKRSVPVSVESNEIVGIEKNLPTSHKPQGSKYESTKGGPPPIGFAM
ncbi:uncharacterized protein FA14DRAFT_156453 [Meira miltonrushii]|uniref:PH domain-containing protein n=1 Tax=Meira miltonrushii TaxID=1280837 RepID=A0A316V8G5_9BASI|nr:uncharacterized protein FA14DRAFT_156453 [Meira miltonrushii]PWN33772.1 hypothetical protein FA14DRAFT_156453 [Meira miltonrushii]